jgi:hypothetical protein
MYARWQALAPLALLVTVTTSAQGQPSSQDGAESLTEIVEQQQQRIGQLEEALEAVAARAEQTVAVESQGGGLRFGGYGSLRAETSDLQGQDSTFTYRRFVLTGDARPGDRLQAYFELELERFTEIEIEKSIESSDDAFALVQAVEGTDGSEISLEQAWTRLAVKPGLNLEAGAMLVPLGRFNLHHDDNQWNLPRRPLVDRGAHVLPAPAAWPELGIGVSGTAEAGGGLLDYRVYVVNGAQLDFELEGEVEAELDDDDTVGVTEFEAEFSPSRGGFARDLNANKAVTARVAMRPAPGREYALSAYFGRYTPDFMPRESVRSIAFDGLQTVGRFELEYEAVYTDWGDVVDVARSFARAAIDSEVEARIPAEDGEIRETTTKIVLADDALASARSGYWLELRRRLHPNWLGRGGFSEPELELTLRLEQVLFDDQLRGLDFSANGVDVIDLHDDARLSRATLGIAHRPTPRWVVSVAAEYAWTDQASLQGLTDYLAAGPSENSAFGVLAGVAFAF